MTTEREGRRARTGTGPKTADGKLRASLNAVRHGLAAKNFILPGENPAEYERRADALFEALAPQDAAQAEMVALVFDDTWKLERLARIERGIALGRIEQLLASTAAAENSAKTAEAIFALGTALRDWEAQPRPAAGSPEFARRVQVLQSALEEVTVLRPDLEPDSLVMCHQRLAGLSVPSIPPGPNDVASAIEVVLCVMRSLMKAGEAEAVEEERLRELLGELALPEEAELKKLARYRKLIEEGLARRLGVLDQLRKLSAAKAPSAPEKAHEYRVRLRVVA